MNEQPVVSLALLLALSGCGSAPPIAPAAPPGTAALPAPHPVATAPAAAPPVVDVEFLRAYVESQGFSRGAPQSIRLAPSGGAVLFLRSQPRDKKQSLFEMTVATGAVRELLTPEALDREPEHLTAEERARRERMRVTSSGLTAFELSKDGKSVVVSLSGKLYGLDRASGKTHPIDAGKGAVIDPHISPDGRWIAYVQDDDVHVVSLDGSGKPQAVTHGGSEDRTHGLAEFAASEELNRFRGFWWSPDSRAILYEEADVSKLEHFTIADPAHPESPPDRFAYPRAGHANANLRFGITRLGSRDATTWLEWDHASLPYVAKVSWSDGAPPTLLALDRLQKNASVLVVDPATGKTHEAMHEHDDAWVNVAGFVVDPKVPRWLRDGSAFVWWSERDGDGRFGLVPSSSPSNVKWLTPKGVQATELLDVDVARRMAVVETTRDGLHFEVDRVSLDGGELTTVAKRDDGSVFASFGDDVHDVYLAYESSLSDVHHVFVRSVDGKVSREIPSLAIHPRLPHPELGVVGPEGMHVAIVRPRAYVEGARYPVIDSVYGGPFVDVVSLDATAMLFEQWMADATGAVVVLIDAKGTPGRGRAWERVISGKLGDVALDGHVEAVRALAAAHPELDGSRVGIYGWSFGGYLSALAALKRPDVYSAAVAIAPVADWRDYDTAYAERYLGLPADNAAAFDQASLLTYARQPVAPSVREPTLLIAHGTADDNVYFLNSLELAGALEQGGRTFTFLPFIGQTHLFETAEAQEIVWTRAAATLRERLTR